MQPSKFVCKPAVVVLRSQATRDQYIHETSHCVAMKITIFMGWGDWRGVGALQHVNNKMLES